MATEILTEGQSKRDVYDYSIDLSIRKPAGETITDVSAVHVPPEGYGTPLTITPSINVDAVELTVGPLATLGRHQVKILSTFSNGSTDDVLLIIDVEW